MLTASGGLYGLSKDLDRIQSVYDPIAPPYWKTMPVSLSHVFLNVSVGLEAKRTWQQLRTSYWDFSLWFSVMVFLWFFCFRARPWSPPQRGLKRAFVRRICNCSQFAMKNKGKPMTNIRIAKKNQKMGRTSGHMLTAAGANCNLPSKTSQKM